MGFMTGQRNDYYPFLLQWDKQLENDISNLKND